MNDYVKERIQARCELCKIERGTWNTSVHFELILNTNRKIIPKQLHCCRKSYVKLKSSSTFYSVRFLCLHCYFFLFYFDSTRFVSLNLSRISFSQVTKFIAYLQSYCLWTVILPLLILFVCWLDIAKPLKGPKELDIVNRLHSSNFQATCIKCDDVLLWSTWWQMIHLLWKLDAVMYWAFLRSACNTAMIRLFLYCFVWHAHYTRSQGWTDCDCACANGIRGNEKNAKSAFFAGQMFCTWRSVQECRYIFQRLAISIHGNHKKHGSHSSFDICHFLRVTYHF